LTRKKQIKGRKWISGFGEYGSAGQRVGGIKSQKLEKRLGPLYFLKTERSRYPLSGDFWQREADGKGVRVDNWTESRR